MKHNYQRTIEVLLGTMFTILLVGFALSIAFLDYGMGYYGEDQEFANLLLRHDRYLIGFTAASIACCFVYAGLDFGKAKHRKFIQFMLALILLGISIYLIIMMVGLRNQAFSVDGYSLNNAFILYKEYRIFSVMVATAQLVISLYAICRSCFSYFTTRKNEAL